MSDFAERLLTTVGYLFGLTITSGLSGLFGYTAYIGRLIEAWFHQYGSINDQLYSKGSDALWGADVKVCYIIAAVGFCVSFLSSVASAFASINLVDEFAGIAAAAALFTAGLSTIYAFIFQIIIIGKTWDWVNTFRNNPTAGLEFQSKFLAGFSLVFPSLGAFLVAIILVAGLCYLFIKGCKNRRARAASSNNPPPYSRYYP